MKILKKILCCVSAAAMLAAFSGCSNDKSKLVMATNAEFAPYEYHEGDGIVGIDVEIALAIAKDNTELLDDINAALTKLKDSGELQTIIDKYITAE